MNEGTKGGSAADLFPTHVLGRPEVRELPPAPQNTASLIGPGIVAAGVGLSSGEFILYPYIASQVGMAEIALLQRDAELWTPLAVGDLPLEIIARADAWLVIPGGSEGFAAGTPVGAYILRE